MTQTEEIVVSGEDFIERRIFVYPQQAEIDNLQRQAYRYGYNRGCVYGLVFGLVLFGVGATLTWLVLW
jgi:tetrahydromethanopterin S-methyltransferase subunit G